jgi:hypothetical protein
MLHRVTHSPRRESHALGAACQGLTMSKIYHINIIKQLAAIGPPFFPELTDQCVRARRRVAFTRFPADSLDRICLIFLVAPPRRARGAAQPWTVVAFHGHR